MATLFTLEEAEALLPRLIPLLEQIRDGYAELRESEAELERLLAKVGGNGHGVDAERVEQTRQAQTRIAAGLQARMAELEAQGVELKDPTTGLIDFRSLREGRVVYLCWRLGEPRIEWWHELEAGFAGRQRLERDG